MNKVIGIIGGVSWESTALYYKLLNEMVHEKWGGLNSAKILIYSLNYAPIVELENQNRWHEIGSLLKEVALNLEKCGANFILLACNTLHKVSDHIEQAIEIQFLHIADAAGESLQAMGIQKIGLLRTLVTMEEDFYSSRLKEKYNMNVIIPQKEDRIELDRIIYQELCQGNILSESRDKLSKIMKNLQLEGAQAILLACTELGMLVNSTDAEIPMLDTTITHTKRAIDLYLKQ